MNALVTTETKPLRAFTADESRGPLMMLFAAYPEPFADRNAEHADKLFDAKVSAYLLGLDGLPKWAIEHTVKDFIQGRIERPARRKGALPTVEEISSEARVHVDREASRQRAEKLVQEQIAERMAPPVGDAERTRMLFKLSLLSAAQCSTDRLDRLASARHDGISDEMLALAQAWGVPIPESIWSMKRA